MKLFYSAMDLADTAVCGSHLQPVFDFTNSLDLLGVLGVFIFSNHFESVPFEQCSWGRGQPTSTALACSNPRFRNKKSCQRNNMIKMFKDYKQVRGARGRLALS